MNLATFRNHSLSRFAAWLAVFAMLAAMVLPVGHHSITATAGKSLICSFVTDNADQQKAPDQHKAKPSCPICQTLGQLAQGYMPPVAPLLVLVALAVAAMFVPPDVFAAFSIGFAYRSRAPPVFA